MNAISVTRMPVDPGISGWDAILPEPQRYSALEENRNCDWLVIGGGFAGLAAARRLQQLHPRDKITLLEARHIAEGPAGRNSGFMIDLPHDLTSDEYTGALDKDRKQIEMNRAAIDFAGEAAAEFEFPEEAFVRSGKINAAASRKGIQHNQHYAEHLNRLGEAHDMLDAKQMQAICGSDYYLGGLYTPGAAMLQPALFIRSIAAGIASKGVSIHENSPVSDLQKLDGDWIAKTPLGSIRAPKVITAVNGHIESFGFFKRRLMHIYLYASMTEALHKDEEQKLGGEATWGFTPSDPLGTTVRKISGIGGSRIVVRNSFTWSPSRSVDDNRAQKFARSHDRSFHTRFSMLDGVKMQYRWGGLLCLSWNGEAAFGEIDNNLYSACCQNGLGTARGTLSGMLAAELASGIKSKHLDEYLNQSDPSRLPPEPFASIGANAYLHWGQFKAGKDF
ncbi:MAG: NAD(P)/FAD-dependent oxidoreductase [Rhizobiaceae bacterium]